MFIGIDSQFGVFSKLADFMKMHSSKKTKTRRTVIRKATGSDSS